MPRTDSESFVHLADPRSPVELLRRIFDWLNIDLVVDVGAYRGDFIDQLRYEVGYSGQIIAFEADPTSFAALETRYENDHDLQIYNLAVCDQPGPVTLQQYDRPNFNSLHLASPQLQQFVEIVETGQVRVEGVRLDEHLNLLNIDRNRSIFLKTDTQGSDLDVIGSCGLWSKRILGIQTELSVLPLYDHVVSYTRAIEFLEGAGWFPAGFFPVTRDPGLLRVVEFDGYFVRDL